MNGVQLNLARKWRSKNFDEVIGQDLPVKMLKNSLYLGHYFPVYLFAGQRGCGKTSTARIFAAAVNCLQLDAFKEQPKDFAIPCLKCQSCKAMAAGSHPDFIEMDAASHTGVDNVRGIIDSSALLPLMGRKKIYLIDEAHMLSKAAFNALLKILEEPPSSALFILATTDAHKIIDTVRSRCFQLYFRPVVGSSLEQHLQNMCAQEGIEHDDRALALIAKESGGAVRDAINLLEQVRFSSSAITHEAVLRVLGHVDDQSMLKLFELIMQGNGKKLLAHLSVIKFDLCSVDFVWTKLVEFTRMAVWIKHGVSAQVQPEVEKVLAPLVKECSWQQLNHIIDLLYSNERLLQKTSAQHAFLEMVLMQMCSVRANDTDSSSGTASLISKPAVQAAPADQECADQDEQDAEEEEENYHDEAGPVAQWHVFLRKLIEAGDAMACSVFAQATFSEIQEPSFVVVTFAQHAEFFKELVRESQTVWQPILQEAFGTDAQLKAQFLVSAATKQQQDDQSMERRAARVAQAQQSFHQQAAPQKSASSSRSAVSKETAGVSAVRHAIDIKDVQAWPKAHLLLEYFPGTVSEIMEESHGKTT